MEPIAEPHLIAETRRRLIGWEEAEVRLDLILKGGSDRSYYRVHGGGKFRGPKTCILMVYSDRRPDNKSFFAATEVLARHGVRTPRIYFHDAGQRLAWMEDLGEADLWSHRHDPQPERLALYQDALEQAAKIHAIKFSDLPESLSSHLQPGFDAALYLWEQDYFFQNFANHFSARDPDEIQDIRRQSQFHDLAHDLAGMPRFLVHRDFQSQNIIIRNRQAILIDYQGLRPGRPEYDLASLLYDPYVELTMDERDDLVAHYLEIRPSDDQWDTNQEILAACCAQRLMQALGAYGYLGIECGKSAFLKHIPRAVANLREILTLHPVLPGLLDVLELRDEPAEISAAVA